MDEAPSFQIAFEYVTEDAAQLFSTVLEKEGNAFVHSLETLKSLVNPDVLSRVRLVLTQEFVRSVHDRDKQGARREAYSMERSTGLVAAKTFPPDADGYVVILVPIAWFVRLSDESDNEYDSRSALLEHLMVHESVHAQMHVRGDDPFDAYKRKELGYATVQLVSCAGVQIEEHLAEYISNNATTGHETGPETMQTAFDSWSQQIDERLRAVPESDPDYFQIGLEISLGAALDIWISIAYLAAELRQGDGFSEVSAEIRALPHWQSMVAPWWDEYLCLLSQVPMTPDVDIPATDEIVIAVGELLQRWFRGMGFELRDQGEGAWFQVHIWS